MADRIALAIEPDTDTADQIRRLLEPKGFQVESIPNGDDAMEWGRTNKPAVIILQRRAAQGRLRDLATSCAAARACARCR